MSTTNNNTQKPQKPQEIDLVKKLSKNGKWFMRLSSSAFYTGFAYFCAALKARKAQRAASAAVKASLKADTRAAMILKRGGEVVSNGNNIPTEFPLVETDTKQHIVQWFEELQNYIRDDFGDDGDGNDGAHASENPESPQ